MGNKSIGPSMHKEISKGENFDLKFACCEMQGWRHQMVY